MSTERFAVALTCIDGRIQLPLQAWVRERLDVDAVDVVTVPGPDAVLTGGDDARLEPLAEYVRVSVRAHGSTRLVVASHGDCAGHPVDDAAHHRDVAAGARRFAALVPELTVLCAHVRRDGDGWRTEPVDCGRAPEPAR